jgi:hypothetical protein
MGEKVTETDHTEVAETAHETGAEIAETVAPGSVTEVHPATTGGDVNVVDAVRTVVREEFAAFKDSLATVPGVGDAVENTGDEGESFESPSRKPWTHRGGH